MSEVLDKLKQQSVYDRIAKRYDVQHAFFTAISGQRRRELLVDLAASLGNTVLDCGTGTGYTGLLAAEKVGKQAK